MEIKTTRGHLASRHQKNLPNDLRVGRNSKYGNPFKIGNPHPDTGLEMTRDDVCDLYIERVLPFLDVEPLRGKRLLCWCKPNERCHVDSLISKLEGNARTAELSLISSAISKIKVHHATLLDLMSKADKRAEAIGNILVDLQPTLKVAGISISQLCEDLPFGKSAAYEYMSLAKGKTTWNELKTRKNTAINSAVAENKRVASMPVVPDYNVEEAMGAIKGIAQMYGKRYNGTTEGAAQVLLDRILQGSDVDDIGLSIARDYANWFLSLKAVMDLAEPEIQKFLSTKPDLKVVC